MENQIIKLDEFKQQIVKAPEILNDNQLRCKRALDAGKFLIEKIEKNGMSNELDKECNDFLVKLRKTYSLVNDNRKPVTQLANQIVKAFTSIENEISDKSEIHVKIQKYRDDHAAEELRKKQEAEREAERKLAIEKEKITVQTIIEEGLTNHVYDYIDKIRESLYKIFNEATLPYFETVEKIIKEIHVQYPNEHFNKYKPSVSYIYMKPDDINIMLTRYSQANFAKLALEYKEAIIKTRDILIDRLPSKKLELEALEKANKEEKERLEKERIKREEEEKQRLADEKKKRDDEAKAQAEMNKQSAIANSLFDNEAKLSAIENPSAQVRKSYEITITNAIGYMNIISFYFEKKGKTESIENLDKMKLSSMKKFCEDWAKKEGEKIQNPYIIYKETIKTIAKS